MPFSVRFHKIKMIDSASSAAFTRLKPLCINLLTNCTVENVTKLESVVKELDSESVQLLQEFIVVPFRAHLNTELSERVTIKCIEFFTLVFKKSSIYQWRFFFSHFSLMMSKICDAENIYKCINTRSEELKLCICENILWLVRCSSADVLNEMYSLPFRPHLAYALFVFNTLLRLEKSKPLLKAVLSATGALLYIKDYVTRSFLITEQIASEALASCLPGVSIALQKVICSDDKQGHSIITMALGILTDLLLIVVGDESFERDIANNSSSEIYQIAYKCGKYSKSLEHINDSIPVVIKDKAWFKDVAEKLEILINNIAALSCHNHWKVRLKYLEFVKLLLFKCTKTLENCIPILLPSVFGLSVDNNEIISSSAKSLLTSFSELADCKNLSSLKSVIDENIEKSITNLIKYKFTANDDKKLAALKSLLGYLEISDLSHEKSFSVIQLERIVLTLITLLEFDLSDSSLVVEIPSTFEFFDVANPVFLNKKFKFFKNEEVLNTICQLCCSLGQIENAQLLIHYLLEKLSGSNLYILQCIFLVGSIIKGLCNEHNASQKYSTLINNVLEVFLSTTLLDVPIDRSDDPNFDGQGHGFPMEEDIPNNILNKNKIQVCLLLEAIARCSECLRTNFKLHLTKVLCPVMEKAGSNNFIISWCGKLCLHYISKSCEYKSVQGLIKDNADYITNILLINFHRYLYNQGMVTVLQTVINQCDAEALLLFKDLIFKILQIIDFNQDKAYPLMIVLNSVVVYIRKWFPCKMVCQESLQKNISYQSLKSLVSNYMHLKKRIEMKSEDIEEEGSKDVPDVVSQDTDATVETILDIPLHINLVCDIFKRCILLQSSENRYLRMLVLETVELCILALRDFENQLLPLVHEFWSPFLKRFAEGTFISKAFKVLLAIAHECGDFIRQRSFKDIIPKVVFFLQKEYNRSLLKCNYKHYQWTNDHSLQILVLSEIGDFCTKLGIDDKEINAVVNVCLPYLEKSQPKVLQDAAIRSLKALASLNSDSVYFYWNVLYCKEKTLIPSSSNLLELSFPFSDNSLISEVFQF